MLAEWLSQVVGHTKGHPVIYCSEDPSTALLETLVHIEIDSEDRPQTFQVLKIQSAQSASVSVEHIDLKKLSRGWPINLAHTRNVGDTWLAARKTLLLEVPSALIPERRNFLINPLHPGMKKLCITARYSHPLDQRFFR